MAYVCITGNEQSTAALEQRLERVLASHPRVLCELRLDCLDLHPPAAFAFLARLPAEMAPRLVLTQRLKASGPLAGGHCTWNVLTWQSWWRDVMVLRPWFAVDLDWLVLDRLAGESLRWQAPSRARHSFFSLHAPLPEIAAVLPELRASAQDHGFGVKIAAPMEGAADLARFEELSRGMADLPLKVAVAMGAAGRAWRWSRLAGDITYFAADAARATAPGQDTLAAVLPYLSTKQRPDLYVLLGDNPENRYGEERWNRAFLRRGGRARYTNSASQDAPGPAWAEHSLRWLRAAGVQGASVTKPYKLCFPEPTNTLKQTAEGWERANTDGEAVARILRRYGLPAKSAVTVAGGGGAARAVQAGLEAEGHRVSLWVRSAGGELAACPKGEAFVSTWPGEYQEALVHRLPESAAFRLVIDAQFSRPQAESPLALWCQERKVAYVPGTVWWREQARLQDRFWFGPNRLGEAEKAVLALVPASKSETIRALALAAACGVPTEIRGAAENDDTAVFLAALEALGMPVDRVGECISLFPPARLVAPAEPIFMGEGATGLRILGALSTLMQGERPLRLAAAPSLEARPSTELRQAFALDESWPLTIPVGRDLPSSVSLERSSQFATGFLLAAAGALYRGKKKEYRLKLEGECRSESYLQLTLALLADIGIQAERRGTELCLTLAEKKNKFYFKIERDASSLSFLEVCAHRWGLTSLFGRSRQGDGAFPEFLRRLSEGGRLSLRDHPDLAPPLWAAAALGGHRLEVVDCPQLHWKECDRARALVEAARQLGVPADERPDGFLVDFRGWVPPAEEVFLRTEGDHRLTMAFGLLTQEFPNLLPDRRDCVRKSFPAFWQALSALDEALPG